MAKDSIENMQSSDNLNEKAQADEENIDIEVVPLARDTTSAEQVSVGEPVAAVVQEEGRPSERREIVRSASLVMVGNLGSSIMGMVRQIVVASTGQVIFAPFLAALQPAQTFNDLLVNGSVPGALIPTFTDYAAPEKRDELRRIVFTIVNLVLLIGIAIAILFTIIAPWFVSTVLVSGFSTASQLRTLELARIIIFSLLLLGPFAVLQAALYALKEFGWPAFATAASHVGIIIGTVAGSWIGMAQFGYLGMAFGFLLGALGEIGLLVPGLRKQRFKYMFVLDLKHPALGRILKLYAPVAVSFLGSMALIFLDTNLSSRTPCASFMLHTALKTCREDNSGAKAFATTLIQFPGGLVAAALSFAVLPTLSAHMREKNMDRFKETLLLGFRLGLLLMIPAAAGLIVLQTPIIALIFEHGNYNADNAHLAALALQNYSYQLPFIALDQLLIFAFYARKNTLIPVIVFFVSILGYLAVALPFFQTIGMPALAFANTVQNSLHALILLVLLRVVIGSLHLRTMIPFILKILLATAAMVALAWGLQLLLGHVALFSLAHLLGRLLTVLVAGGLAAVAYFGLVLLFKVEEIGLLKGVLLAKLGRG
ncbi:MAG TPA: lipid II flippase MurJ [Ktedonobacteraceae bacterium]|nr:lipid II flippase MurJ [Ktedonobacteraceae bacterium]